MPNPEHLTILKQGVEAWNKWIEGNPKVIPDLSGTDLSGAILHGVDLISADLNGADLSDADLNGADLSGANLIIANLRGANLRGANLSGANLKYAKLGYADLRDTKLMFADLSGANLEGADVSGASMGPTYIASTDLSDVVGLAIVTHARPSSIGIDTLYESHGEIPESFLRGCGVPEEIIDTARSIRAGPAIQWHSCFISYSAKDEEFARRLHARMREAGLRVWFAPENLKGGKKQHEQLFEAIQLYDKLLLILSEQSIKSEWVMTEIRKAREVEKKENRRKLFPIRLVDFETLRDWTCFDADAGKDLAVEVREYFIPDLSNWKDHDAFEAAFAKLQKDLKAEGKPKGV